MIPPRDLKLARLTHVAEQIGIDRRRFLMASGGSLGALFLAACDSVGPKSATKLLKFAEAKNESVERLLFRHTSLDVPRSSAMRRSTTTSNASELGEGRRAVISVVLRLEARSGVG